MSTPALRVAASGMMAQQRRVDVIANNLANVSTTGFKGQTARFADLLYRNIEGTRLHNLPASTVGTPIQIGSGVRLVDVARSMGQGPLTETSRPLDLAIEGDGYFQIERADGSIAYTRDGTFNLSDQGQMVTSGGLLLLPGITVPADGQDLTVSPQGTVSVVINGDRANPIELGRIELVRFQNPAGLEAIGENLFLETPSSGFGQVTYPGDPGTGAVRQGYVEGANVQIITEMVQLIEAQRGYETNAKAITTVDEMTQRANEIIR